MEVLRNAQNFSIPKPTPTPLTESDLKVLKAVFDPESAPGRPVISISTMMPEDPHIKERETLCIIKNKELQAVRLVESVNTSDPAAKDFAYRRAAELFNSIINDHPMYASAYNNRAQLTRCLYPDISNAKGAKEHAAELEQTIADLNRAISLLSPREKTAAISINQSRTLRHAWTQLGLIYRDLSKRDDDSENDVDAEGALQATKKARKDSMDLKDAKEFRDLNNAQSGPEWKKWDSFKLAEEGSKAYDMAGLYGGEKYLKTLAVHTNPYAKMCGQIVEAAMAGEFGQ